MKRFYLFFVCALSICIQMFSQEIVETSYYKSHPDLGGDVVISSSTKAFTNKSTSISFSVIAKTDGDFYTNFWLIPTAKPNGEFFQYKVKVNGFYVGAIKPKVGGWQSISLENNHKIKLQHGTNTISIIGMAPDVPNVEHVRLTTMTDNNKSESLNYKAYIDGIQQALASEKQKGNFMLTNGADSLVNFNALDNSFDRIRYAPATTTENPLYDFEYCTGMTAHYTFYKTVYFTQGQQIFLATDGIDDFQHVLEFFSVSNPENHSWSSMSNSNSMASLNITIPQTGMYNVRVRSYLNARSGFCNLNINGENYYNSIPVYSIGVRCTQDTDQVYNTFTVKSEGDPMIWIEEGTSIPGKIMCYNDDYQGTGNFAWGLNSRIKKNFIRPVHSVLISTYSSYNPTAKFDLYMKCKDSNVYTYFQNLLADDAIQSSPATWDYNCISWSGGITSYWEWPDSYFSSFWAGDALSSFDAFYQSRGLTREGANASNAVVALWAIVDSQGNRSYTHASVRKGDGHLHGYDWESKPGSLARTFHPKEALIGDSYGQIVEYYTTISNSLQASNARTKSLEEEIADGRLRIEYVNFDDYEKQIIAETTREISSSVMRKFTNLYELWKDVTENTTFSSLAQMARCDEYKNLLSFCNANPELLYVLYEYLDDGDWATIKVIEDMTFTEDNYQSYKATTKAPISATSDKIYRTPVSNCIIYVKSLLEKNMGKVRSLKKANATALTGVSYSNSNNINVVNYANNTLNVNFDLQGTSKVSLSAWDLNGNRISAAFDSEIMEAGVHTAALNLNNNRIILVKLVVNGHINVRKITVK